MKINRLRNCDLRTIVRAIAEVEQPLPRGGSVDSERRHQHLVVDCLEPQLLLLADLEHRLLRLVALVVLELQHRRYSDLQLRHLLGHLHPLHSELHPRHLLVHRLKPRVALDRLPSEPSRRPQGGCLDHHPQHQEAYLVPALLQPRVGYLDRRSPQLLQASEHHLHQVVVCLAPQYRHLPHLVVVSQTVFPTFYFVFNSHSHTYVYVRIWISLPCSWQ